MRVSRAPKNADENFSISLLKRKLFLAMNCMLQKTILITNRSGLHARPAYSFVHAAKSFVSDITISVDGETANAKSMLSILGLGIDCGARIQLRASGSDEGCAISTLITLLEDLSKENT